MNTKTIATKITKNLEFILNSGLFVKQLENKTFCEVVEKQINILNFCEKDGKSEKTNSPQLLKKYNELTKGKFKIDTSTKYDDKDLLEDDVNYLNVFFKNLYSQDFDELKAKWKKSPKEEKEHIKIEQTDILGKNQTSSQKNKNQKANPFGSNPFMGSNMFVQQDGGNFTGDPQQNPWYINQANARLQKEFADGTIYYYKTKPKAVLIGKLAVIVVSLLLFTIALIAAVFSFMSTGALSTKHFDSNTNEALPFSGTSAGIIFIFYSISAIFVALMNLKGMISLPKKETKINDNQRYYFYWQIQALFAFFFILVLLTTTLIGSAGTTFNIISDDLLKNPLNSDKFVVLNGLYYSMIGIYAVLGLLIAAIGITAYFNPKRDDDKIMALKKVYIDEIASHAKKGK